MRGLARMRWVAVAAALAMVATACGGDDDDDDVGASPGPTSEEPAAGGSFTSYIGEPQFLVPGNANETSGAAVLEQIFTGLYDFDDDLNLVPAMAEGLPETTDNTTFTIKIKPGWTFHNGEPVTAQSYVNGWNTTAFGPNAWNNNYFMERIEGYGDLNPAEGEPTATELTGLRAVDDTTLEVTLGAPFSSFPLLLQYTAFYPLADACIADLDACNEAPIGNGPYQLQGAWEHNVRIVIEKFPDYQGEDKGFADEITFGIYETQDAAYADLVAGEIDLMNGLPAERVVEARTTFGDRLIEDPTSSFTYVGFPLYQEEFQNPLLRQAFSLAIDRQAIIDSIFDSRFAPADNLMAPVVTTYVPGVCEFCTYDPVRAKELYDQAGGFEGDVVFWFNAGVGHEEWMQAVGDQLVANLGIDGYEFKGDLEFPDYLSTLDGGVFDDDPATEGSTGPFRLGWVFDYPSGENYLTPLHGTGGSSNYTGYSNPDVDALISQGDAASIEEADGFYQQAAELVLEDMPIIPMWFGQSSIAYNETITGVVSTPRTILDLTRVQVVG